MNLIPPVRAALAERFIFNFRMPLAAMAEMLPAPWLTPLPVRGWGVASFCLLDLRHITAAPLPTVAGINSISCAPRFAVLDHSDGTPRPAVFVETRQTSSPFGAWFTSLGFSCRHPFADAQITHCGVQTQISVTGEDRNYQFGATVREAEDTSSALFDSCADFGAFIAEGVASYGPSRWPDQLTMVDLHKEDHGYTPLDVLTLESPLLAQWQAGEAVLDSAFRTSGGHYEWTYHGLREINAGGLLHGQSAHANCHQRAETAVL